MAESLRRSQLVTTGRSLLLALRLAGHGEARREHGHAAGELEAEVRHRGRGIGRAAGVVALALRAAAAQRGGVRGADAAGRPLAAVAAIRLPEAPTAAAAAAAARRRFASGAGALGAALVGRHAAADGCH